ncbi:MAG: cytochrome c oxidase, cbb3-type, subunit [Rickettsiaceae bacterium]|jgi:cytochrome c oxidase cbb3-type subunit 3|nr:cytochrome c oxidase, cbb3-type, subunit [Rickettsiaceae bacterium]
MNKKPDQKIKNNPETTGHSWDKIEEYNTPAPRWWLIVWLISIIWAIAYWFFYPTWPTPGGNSKGLKNWSKYSELKTEQVEIEKKKEIYLKKFNKASFSEIKKDKELMQFAINGGKAAFQNNCAVCHGTGAAGQKGFPNLNDDDWLWGGKIEDIYTTILYGIRSTHEKTRSTTMPSFGVDKILTKQEIEEVANHVLSFSGQAKPTAKGAEIFKNNCVACHGPLGKGERHDGAPNLTDKIWLYGGKKEDVIYTITHARNGVMPTWKGRLDESTIRQLAIYVHSLGGGE